MKAALYHPWVYLKGGAERTLLELARRSRHSWTIYTNHYDARGTFPEFQEVDVVELDRVSVRRTVRDVGSAVLRVLAQRLPINGAKALMVSSEGVGNLAGLHGVRVPVFCFCHTPLKVAYDPFTRERYFVHQRPNLMVRSAISLYTRVDRLGWRRYTRVFCNSHEVASRVINARLAEPERVEVAYPGVDQRRFDPHGPRERFFLLAGRIARTKNIELGIDAFRQFKRIAAGAEDFRLVIAGMVDEKSRPYYEEMRRRANGGDDITFVVEPSDRELAGLYSRCYVALFTPLNEDWGLVPLEAMASARPVVSVGRGGPLESIVHGKTGLLCPAEPEAFAAAMEWLVSTPQAVAAMGEAARRHSAIFSWEAFVDKIDDYVEVLAEQRQPALAA